MSSGSEITFIFFYNCVQFVQNLKTDQLNKIILGWNTLCLVLLVRQSAEGKHYFKSGLILNSTNLLSQTHKVKNMYRKNISILGITCIHSSVTSYIYQKRLDFNEKGNNYQSL